MFSLKPLGSIYTERKRPQSTPFSCLLRLSSHWSPRTRGRRKGPTQNRLKGGSLRRGEQATAGRSRRTDPGHWKQFIWGLALWPQEPSLANRSRTARPHFLIIKAVRLLFKQLCGLAPYASQSCSWGEGTACTYAHPEKTELTVSDDSSTWEGGIQLPQGYLETPEGFQTTTRPWTATEPSGLDARSVSSRDRWLHFFHELRASIHLHS